MKFQDRVVENSTAFPIFSQDGILDYGQVNNHLESSEEVCGFSRHKISRHEKSCSVNRISRSVSDPKTKGGQVGQKNPP